MLDTGKVKVSRKFATATIVFHRVGLHLCILQIVNRVAIMTKILSNDDEKYVFRFISPILCNLLRLRDIYRNIAKLKYRQLIGVYWF